MARFYFHIEIDGQIVEDPEGEEFEDLDAARTKAMKAIREIIGNRIAHGGQPDGGHLLIDDADDRQVTEISFAEAIGLQ